MSEPSPTYGNWRRPKSPGLGRLGTAATLAFFVGFIVVVFASMTGGLGAGLVAALVVAVGLGPMVYRDRWGRSGYERLGERIGWVLHRMQRHHLYVSGPLSRTPSVRASLPGLAASMSVFDARDAHGRPFVVLHHPRPGHVSTVLECSPSGDALVDPAQVDQWVAGWGGWLAGLSHEAGLVAAAVTVETVPDTGIRLRRSIEGRLDPDAPPMAVATMREVQDTFREGAAATSCRVSLTWTRARAGSKKRTVEDMAVEIGTRLPELGAALAAAGAGSARPMTSGSLAAAVRAAYDPDIAVTLEEAGDDHVEWDECGPVQAEERPGAYLHDGAVSVSWVMGEAPRGAIRSSLLRRLLEPNREVARKRVTMLYRPYAPATAAALVDRDVLDARFQATQRRVIRARDSVQVRSSEKAAEEEALGAGLVRFATIVTATLPVDGAAESVPRCVSVVEHLGGSARIRLRRAWRAQSATFTAGLPLGLVLPAHISMPGDWRERL